MGNSKDNSDDLKIIENKYKLISKMTDDSLILRDNQIEMKQELKDNFLALPLLLICARSLIQSNSHN